MIIVDSKWLASHLDDPNLVIIDTRDNISYRFRHIKNARPLEIERVISVADNGANLVIDGSIAEKVFTELGIDNSKTVVVYGEYGDPSAARVVWTLIYHGHTNVKLLDIGFSQWQKARITNYQTNSNSKTIHFSIQVQNQFYNQSRCSDNKSKTR